MTLAQIARELGVRRSVAGKVVRKLAFAYPPSGDPPTYDARLIDLWRAMHDQPHRTLEPVHQDWLTTYLKGTP